MARCRCGNEEREKTDIGWKKRKEGAECATSVKKDRQLNTCGMGVEK
jgi:hypothetical protein